MKTKIDYNKITEYIEANKSKKPKYINVADSEWSDALLGYEETFSNAVDEDTTTDMYWHLIYFSALAFCKGMEYAEVKAGLRKESNYPRY